MRVKTPTVLQMEAVECGAAALAIILAYLGRWVPLEELRVACGVSRDGSKASNVVKAARTYGLTAKGFRKEPQSLPEMQMPVIVHWKFNHFLVVEGFSNGKVFLNDPASGPYAVTSEEFDESFTGVVLTFEPTAEFHKGGKKFDVVAALRSRLIGSGSALLFVILAGLSLVIPGLIVPSFTRIFVDYYLVRELNSWLVPLLLGMVATLLLTAALTWVREYYLLRLETKLAASMSGKFLWHVLRLPMEYYLQRYAGEIGGRVSINDQVAYLLSGRLASTFLDIIAIFFYAILMFIYDPLLTLVGIFFAFLNIVALRYVARKRVDLNQRVLQESGKMTGVAMSGLYTIETLKAIGRESDFFSRWAGYQAKLARARQEMAVYTQYLSIVPPLLTALNTTAILTLGSMKVIEGQLSIGMLIAFQSLMYAFLAPVNKLVDLGSTLQDVQGGLKRLDDVLGNKADTALDAKEDWSDQSKRQPRLTGYLELKNLKFGYSRLESPLIENFNLTLQPGSRVALVGGSGSGKSTVAKLVSGLYQSWEGEILFDGKPRTDIPRSVITNSLAVVDQDIFLFEGSVRDNLTMWDPTIPDQQVIQASKDAGIHNEIAARPGGYASNVAEEGVNFSGGQRQRLEIARALAGNPAVLILDEATSALDPVTESLIDQNLRRRGCTCLIIAHRLSTIRDCDEIIVLERGKIVQRGTHEQMKNVKGPYSRLIATE
ncbi:MAG: NHLP family bacteriocin export ABC transporter peptidase/permease/ATPase subunit [Chloroflexi bacterium]|uniref:NHLP family bacteriocin export ABC transporter peptidase/permease/ATPase subunit n=1 Tax=Candidatus Chlorohelix allophototropha TaxID=3003348 RepID=A0A8T7M547_9CHLR|nr:NHLP family bacteriocin export ABC transporter peptidase/permease/ATPase subunit [Chloroflexota bacterium]WJW69158.1 NHLP family bacteriocin export ABC transporter peptidase/permease/ATPase subunit [Chloroflexota bacterium L227-S17]